jgi:hypothetical protein
MTDIAVCQCGFSVPWDEIGKALMVEHLKKDCPILNPKGAKK